MPGKPDAKAMRLKEVISTSCVLNSRYCKRLISIGSDSRINPMVVGKATIIPNFKPQFKVELYDTESDLL